MRFDPFIFILAFLPLLVFLAFRLSKTNSFFLKLLLLASSCCLLCLYPFFSKWLLLSVVVNFLIGKAILKPGTNRKRWLWLGLAFNIASLLFFRLHADAFALAISVFLLNIELPHWVMPIGIAFITLQQSAFLLECYRREITVLKPLDYLLCIAFFPKALAGPLLAYKELTDQAERKISYEDMAQGISLFGLGLLQKIFLADILEKVAITGLDASSLNAVQAWVVALANLLSVFFSFSSYSNMAIGTGMMLGIMLPENFNNPLSALNIREFWQRWYMPVSRFFFSNLYDPFQERAGVFGILITFMLMGFWYSIGVPVLIWASLHALALIVYRLWPDVFKMPSWLSRLLTFGFLLVSFLFFRATDVSSAFMVLKGMLSIRSLFVYYNEWYILWPLHANYLVVLLILGCLASFYLTVPSWLGLRAYSWPKMALLLVLVTCAVLAMHTSRFLYLPGP